MSKKPAENATSGEGRGRRKILVVGNEDYFTEDIADYAIHLADRLGYDILAANVGLARGGDSPTAYQEYLREGFRKRAYEAGEALKRKAASKAIHCEHVVRFGKLGVTVGQLVHEFKRVEFVVTESEANKGKVAEEVTIPVFSAISNQWNDDEGEIMAENHGVGTQKLLGKTVGFGALTVACYAAVFWNADSVTQLFSRGGWFAALPIVTVFAFSFVHGSFANYLWSLLGIEAKKRVTDQPAEKKDIRDVKRARKRPRVYARINPFHRM